jgi:hypothetical protein
MGALWLVNLDPPPQPVPARIAGFGRQVGEDQPGIGVAVLPAGKQRTVQTACAGLEGGAAPAPTRAWARDEAGQRQKEGLARRPERAAFVDPQEGMPAQADDAPKQPACVQAPIGQDQDHPGRRDGGLEQTQHPQPLPPPGMFLAGRQNRPGDRERAAPIDNADHQHGEAIAQGGGVEGQSQLRSVPATQNPAQQRNEAGLDRDLLAFLACFGCGFPTKLAQALSHGVELLIQRHGQEGCDGGDRAGAGADHA